MSLNWKKSLLVLAGILLLGGFLRIYKLDNMSLKADEFIGANIAQGHNQSGQWKFWDWNKQQLTEEVYTRGQVYYWQTSQLLNFLSPTEFNLRLTSVIWGMIGIVLMFFVGYFYSKNFVIALLSALLWAVSISAITFDRHFRMYAMFAPVYLSLSMAIYQFLESTPQKTKKCLDKLSLKTGLNWKYFVPAFLLLIFSFATHLLTINVFPTITVYILFFAIWEFEKNNSWKSKYTWLLLLPLVSLPVLFLSGLTKKALNFFGFMENNFGHFENVTTDYSLALLAVTFFTIGAIGLIKTNLKKGTWLLFSFLIPFLLAIFIWNRSSGAQYIHLVQPFKVIIVASGLYFVAQKISDALLPKKWYQFFQKTNPRKTLFFGGVTLFLFALLYNFSYFSDPNSFYANNKKWDRSNYKQVLSYYLKHREPEALLITRDFRNYYYAGVRIPVYDFGGSSQPEKELTLGKLQALESQNRFLWIVISDNDFDYIDGDARKYIRANYESIETTYTSTSMEIWKSVK